MLEAYVHIPPELRDVLPILQAVRISIPDDANTAHVSQEQLVTMLESEDPLAACRATGDSWLDRNTELVLQVPSILVPEEMNLMLNPAHPRMREVKIISSRAFRFDARLAVTKA